MSNRKRLEDLLNQFEPSQRVGEIASNNTLKFHKSVMIDGNFENNVWCVYTGYSAPCVYGTADEVAETLHNLH